MRLAKSTAVALLLELLLSGPLAAEDTEQALRVVFSVSGEADSGIYVTSGDGGTQAQRLTRSASDQFPRWSPDGSRIAFLSVRPDDRKLAGRYNLPHHGFVYVMDRNGGNTKRLSDAPASLPLAWSPDGKRMLFPSSYEDERNYGRDGLVSSAIYVVDSDGGNPQRLTRQWPGAELSRANRRHRFPTWSPSGSQIAFCSDRGGDADLFVMQDDGSGVRHLTDDPAVELAPRWSPDGRRVAYAAWRGGRPAGTFVVRADGLEPRRIGKGHPIAWLPDGGHLLLRSKGELWIAGPDGTSRRMVTNENGRLWGLICFNGSGTVLGQLEESASLVSKGNVL